MQERSRSDDRTVSAFGGLVLTLLAFAAMYGLVLAFGYLYGLRHDLPLHDATLHVQQDLLTLTLAQLAGMGGSLFIGLRIFVPDASLAEALEANPVRTRTLAVGFLAGLSLQFPLTELANALHAYVFGPDPLAQQVAVQRMLEAHNILEGAIVVTSLVALVPLAEELFFRGFLLFGMTRRYGPVFGVLISACLFGVVHLGAVPALYATAAGVVLGLVALWTRSVWPGVALHAAVNAVPVLLPERVLPIRGFNVPSEVADHLSPWLVWPPLLVALLLLAWLRRIEYVHEG